MRTMDGLQVVAYFVAPPGAGKSALVVRDLVTERLPNSDGIIITNLPLKKELIAEYLAKKTGRPEAEFLGRIELLPAATMEAWKNGTGGPWELASAGVDGCDLILDEVHNFCPKGANRDRRNRWEQWLGEYRHEGWHRVLFISQDESKVGHQIESHATLKYGLVNSELRRDFFFGIGMSDWYELRAKFLSGEYSPSVHWMESRKAGNKWLCEHSERFVLDPFYFQFYNSYSATIATGHAGTAIKRQFQTRSRLGLLWWFCRRNWWRVLSRCGAIAFFFYLMLGGFGQVVPWIQKSFVSGVKYSAAANGSPYEPTEAAPGSRPARPVGPGAAAAGVPPVNAPRDKALLDQLKAAEDKARQAEKELSDLREKVAKSFSLALLSAESVTFRGGFSYRLGEVIDVGPFAGLSIQLIDWRRRSVRLSDGQILRMGGEDVAVPGPPALAPGVPEPGRVSDSPLAAAGVGRASDVRSGVQSTQGGATTTEAGTKGGTAVDDLRGKNAPRFVPAVGQRPGWGQRGS